MNFRFATFLLLIFTIIQPGFTKEKPNVIIIYTDDHRYSGLGYTSNNALHTPNIDALAADGISFSSAFLMGSFSGATCVPSRAMLLTGRHLFSLKGQGHNIPVEHTTIGEAFSASGYHSHIFGKWHQDKNSYMRAFDSGGRTMAFGVYTEDHFRMPTLQWNNKGKLNREDALIVYYDEKGQQRNRPIAKNEPRGPISTEEDGPHSSEIYAADAVDFISEYKKKKPFFIYLAFHAPHDPRQAPKEYRDLYPPESIELPPSYLPQHPFDNGHIYLRDEQLAPWPRTPEIARQQLADYYAIISHLDAQIGKVIQALKNAGFYKNTIIVLAGDSGLAVGCHGLLGKQNIYNEDGIHIPLIFSGGLINDKGRTIDALCYNYDIFPTLCDLSGVPVPTSVNGLSLRPVIDRETDQIRDHCFYAYRQFQRAYRKGDFKLIEYVRANDSNKQNGNFIAGSRVSQLFNIREDPWEVYNLAYFPEYFSILEELREAMKKEAVVLGDKGDKLAYGFDFWDYWTE